MNRVKLLFAGCAALILSASAAMPVFADGENGTVEDVYDAMRRIGIPETMIQEARVQYQNTEHDKDGMKIKDKYYTYDVWADMVELYEDDIWENVGKQVGVSGAEIKQAAQEKKKREDSGSTEKWEPSVLPEKPFVNMTLEEKKAYISSLPQEERARFLVEISVHERNSIIKQMDRQSQADLASGFIDLGKDLGMNISVDNLGADGIDYSVRNEDGALVVASTVGVSIDDTGWDTTVPVLTGALMILGAVGGIAYFGLRMRRGEQEA